MTIFHFFPTNKTLSSLIISSSTEEQKKIKNLEFSLHTTKLILSPVSSKSINLFSVARIVCGIRHPCSGFTIASLLSLHTDNRGRKERQRDGGWKFNRDSHFSSLKFHKDGKKKVWSFERKNIYANHKEREMKMRMKNWINGANEVDVMRFHNLQIEFRSLSLPRES